MPIELAIKRTGEKWLARGHSRYMVPRTQDSFPELQLRRHANGKLAAKCDLETLAVVTTLMQPQKGDNPQLNPQATEPTIIGAPGAAEGTLGKERCSRTR